jgi:hypothetical protein
VVPGNGISDIVISGVSDPTLDAQNLYLVLARGVKMAQSEAQTQRGLGRRTIKTVHFDALVYSSIEILGESTLVSKAMY